jgi:hypothetical protein
MAVGGNGEFVSRDVAQLMITVIALSLMISPLWLLTARRAQKLAAGQANDFRAVWDDIYGKETVFIVRASKTTVQYLKFRKTSRPRGGEDHQSSSSMDSSETIIQSEAADTYQAILEGDREREESTDSTEKNTR